MDIEESLESGVTVKVPTQSKNVSVETRPIPTRMPATKDVFTPRRVLVNFVVVESADSEKLVTTFNPPLQLEVKYTQQDVANAKGKELTLAFWDGSVWVPFTSKKHKFRLEADTSGGGTGFVEITSWGDPPLAWGP